MFMCFFDIWRIAIYIYIHYFCIPIFALLLFNSSLSFSFHSQPNEIVMPWRFRTRRCERPQSFRCLVALVVLSTARVAFVAPPRRLGTDTTYVSSVQRPATSEVKEVTVCETVMVRENFCGSFFVLKPSKLGMMCVYFVISDDMMLPMCKGPHSFCLGGGGLNTRFCHGVSSRTHQENAKICVSWGRKLQGTPKKWL